MCKESNGEWWRKDGESHGRVFNNPALTGIISLVLVHIELGGTGIERLHASEQPSRRAAEESVVIGREEKKRVGLDARVVCTRPWQSTSGRCPGQSCLEP